MLLIGMGAQGSCWREAAGGYGAKPGFCTPFSANGQRPWHELAAAPWVRDEEQQRIRRIQRLRQQYLDGTLRFDDREVARRMVSILLKQH